MYNVTKTATDINGLSYYPTVPSELADVDVPCGENMPPCPAQEVSDIEREEVRNAIAPFKDTPINILEIGVCRSGLQSFTHILLDKHPASKYLGIDLDDKSYLDNALKSIYTIQANSNEQYVIRCKLKELAMLPLSILFIDGWHSVNMVINDWKYSDLLVKGGVVIFHDVHMHPGPNIIMSAIDRNMYDVSIPLQTNMSVFGIGIAKKRL